MKIQLKRSNVLDGGAAKEPTPAQMEFGELAVNYNENDPAIFLKDNDGNIVRIAGNDAVGNDPGDIDGYPDIGDGLGTTLDDRYLKLGAAAGAQTVATSELTTFTGNINTKRLVSNQIRSQDDTNRITLSSGGASGMALTTSSVIAGSTGSRSLQINWSTNADLGVGVVNVQSVFNAIGTSTQDVVHFATTTQTNQNTSGNLIGFKSNIGPANNTGAGGTYAFYGEGNSPSFLTGSAYIGGNTTRNTFELWKSTLTEEQLEQLTAGTLVAPANVSTTGDGEFARQWYYDQQNAETQAELTAGTQEYPTHLLAANFTDTFALGDNTNINLLSNGKIQAKNINLGTNSIANASDLSFKDNSIVGYEDSLQFTGDRDSRVDFRFDEDGINFDATAGNTGTRRAHYIDKNYINANAIYFPAATKDFDTNTTLDPSTASTSCMVWRDTDDRVVLSSKNGRAFSVNDRACVSYSRYYSILGSPTADGGSQYAFNVRTTTPAGFDKNIFGVDSTNTFTGSNGGTPTTVGSCTYFGVKALWENWEATDTIGEMYGINIASSISPAGSEYNGITKCYGVRSGIGIQGSRENYNFYASGTAPNYFKGLVESEGGVKVTGGSQGTSNIHYNSTNSRLRITPLGVNTGIALDDTTGNVVIGGGAAATIADNSTLNINCFSGNRTRGAFVFGTGGSGDLTNDIVGFQTQMKPKTDGTDIGNNFYAFASVYGSSDWTNGADKIAGDVVSFNAGPNSFAPCTGSPIAFRATNNTNNSHPGKGAYNFYASGDAPNYFAGSIVNSATPTFVRKDPTMNSANRGVRIDGTSTYAISVNMYATGTGATCLELNRLGSTTNGPYALFFEEGNPSGSIRCDNGGVSYNETSDYRLKTKIAELGSVSERIKSLHPVSFEYTSHPDHTHLGFIAHELQTVVPQAVSGTKDETEEIGTLVDYDGTVLETAVVEPEAGELTYTQEIVDETQPVLEGEEPRMVEVTRTKTWASTGTKPVYQGVDQSKLIPLLTKALQEALDKIDTLETRLETLENA